MRRLQALVADATAGDPIDGLRWTHKSTRKLAAALTENGLAVSPNTVGRLLKAHGYSLRTNRKQLARVHEPERDRQFRYIAQLRKNKGDIHYSSSRKNKDCHNGIGTFSNYGRRTRPSLDGFFDEPA